ncbi:unnamed protein product [Aureobasidium vineae]|uniref:2EXR domain-containing protein n=1 Tax=Aureobasidium vineae TaxID=2773715 RepID=A0A9N8K0E7_9PEZI|nr:unnamed protein product [Aureobasidium vineae]
MTVPAPAFRLFAQLPAELRLKVWRYCLPHRVCELDQPVDRIVFNLDDDSSSPCQLYQTTYQNGRPPLISHVCRESRFVATESGGSATVCDPDRPLDTQWISGTDNSDAWFDTTPDSPHLNWTSGYEADYDYSGDSLQCLVWEASRMSATPSIMLTYLDPTAHEPHASRLFLQTQSMLPVPKLVTPDKVKVINAYKQLSAWLVVMRVVVVHAHLDAAAATGLFSLLGDAPVQIVPASDQARLNRFYDLAEECERRQPVTVAQDLTRQSADSMRQHLRRVITTNFHSDELTTIMHPAIMFRLCTRMCNHRVEI